METVFLDLNNIRYKWNDTRDGKRKITTANIDTSDISIGIISEKSFLKLKLNMKALFFDLGETLVTHDNISGKFIEFPEIDIILKNLKENGIEIGIISDGSRSQVNNLLANPSLLNKFKVIVMSDDQAGGTRKPKAKIFNIALNEMSNALGFNLDPTETALLTETIDHFKVYNFLYTLGLKDIINNDCNSYINQ